MIRILKGTPLLYICFLYAISLKVGSETESKTPRELDAVTR